MFLSPALFVNIFALHLALLIQNDQSAHNCDHHYVSITYPKSAGPIEYSKLIIYTAMNEIPLKGEVKSSNFAIKIIYHHLNRALY